MFYLVEETWGRGWCVGWADDSVAAGEVLLGEKRGALSGQLARSVKQYAPPAGRGRRGELFWETRAQAARAMRVARLTAREGEEGRPWPGWAKQAIAEGWKPPKRWRPRSAIQEAS